MVPLRYNVRNLFVRKATTFAAAAGVGLVVFVLASSLMLSNGIQKTLGASGRADTAVVLRKGSDAETNSVVDEPNVGLILAAPGVAADAKGSPRGAGEVVLVISMEKSDGAGLTNVMVRGVTEQGAALREGLRVVAGRPPRPGADEAMIGARLRGRFRGFELGQPIALRKNRPVTIVGVFEDGGSSTESEVWADRDFVRSAFGREGTVSSVRARLSSAAAFDAFKTVVEQDKNLGFEAVRETTYYEKQSEGISIFVSALGGVIAVFFSFGAMIGALITMHASVSSRQREIGTLRALGFSRTSILLAFLAESIALALIGGVAGALASTAMGFVSFSMINFASFSELVFSFEPTPQIVGYAVAFAGLMGVLGGFLPALRAARISPVEAMRG
ncbi:MAG TPA: ABC transporter permease [Polyangiaceae bacterium]|nr:ABC transporter permease [Polyangiaceae bacterium]